MSEQHQLQSDSPLVGERGRTIISDTVVSTIAGRAAQEVEGVYMGGAAARAASGILGSVTGSESQTRGVSVEVGTVEAAIDLTMGIEYGRMFLPTVEEVRRRISERVQSMTGLRVTELNATISEVIFPEEGGDRLARLLPGATTGERETSTASAGDEQRPTDTTEEARLEGEPPQGDETAELGSEGVSEARRPPEEGGRGEER